MSRLRANVGPGFPERHMKFHVTDGRVWWAGEHGSIHWTTDAGQATAVSRSEAMVIKSNYKGVFPSLRMQKSAPASPKDAEP